MENLKIKRTEDGSTTLFHESLNEHYHSIYGALQEAKHIYIQAGFEKMSVTQNHILEIGFGTGLNTLLTKQYATKKQKKIIYTSIDLYPLNESIVAELDFGIAYNKDLRELHTVAWNTPIHLNDFFELTKLHQDLCTYEFPCERYDLVYYDAFAPDKQPEVWSYKVLGQVVAAMKKQAILVTYSTKGIVKQSLRKLGLQVKRLPGPLGKKDMLYCIKA